MNHASMFALLARAAVLGFTIVSCGQPDQVVLASNDRDNGSLRLALETGGRQIDTVTAVISGDEGFETQTHEIDVSGESGSISIFFGELPEADYEITLTAADCSGSSEFSIRAGEVEFVNVALACGGSSATGAVQITGTILEGAPSDCDHVLKIVAAPSIQIAGGPLSSVELFLKPEVEAKQIEWSVTSSDGGSGVLFEVDGGTDTEVMFECSSNGTVDVMAAVTAPCDDQMDCIQQARAKVECRNHIPSGPACGDGAINQPSEQCDGAVLPADTSAGSTCSASCTIVPPP